MSEADLFSEPIFIWLRVVTSAVFAGLMIAAPPTLSLGLTEDNASAAELFANQTFARLIAGLVLQIIVLMVGGVHIGLFSSFSILVIASIAVSARLSAWVVAIAINLHVRPCTFGNEMKSGGQTILLTLMQIVLREQPWSLHIPPQLSYESVRDRILTGTEEKLVDRLFEFTDTYEEAAKLSHKWYARGIGLLFGVVVMTGVLIAVTNG